MKRYFLIPFFILMIYMALFPIYIFFEQNVWSDETIKTVLFLGDVIGLVLISIMTVLFIIWVFKRSKDRNFVDSLNDLPNWFFILIWVFFGVFIFGGIIDPEPAPPTENLFHVMVNISAVVFVVFMFAILSVSFIKVFRSNFNNKDILEKKKYFLVPFTILMFILCIILIVLPFSFFNVLSEENWLRITLIVLLSVATFCGILSVILFIKWSQTKHPDTNYKDLFPKYYSMIGITLYLFLGVNILALGILDLSSDDSRIPVTIFLIFGGSLIVLGSVLSIYNKLTKKTGIIENEDQEINME